MAAYRRVYDSRHLQADCQEPGLAPEPYAGYVYLFNKIVTAFIANTCWAFPLSPYTRPPKVTLADICPPHLPSHRSRSTRSTQPCIPPGSLNRVPASAGVKAGSSPLPGGR